MKLHLSRKQLIIGGIVIVAIFIIFSALSAKNNEQDTYLTDTVKKGDLVQTVDVTGELSPVDEVNLSFAESGIIDSLPAKVGNLVTKGTVLAALEADDVRADVSRAQADVNLLIAGNATAADLAVAKAQIDVAKANAQAAEIDAGNKATALDYARTVADAQVVDARLALESAEQSLEEAKDNSGSGTTDTSENLVKALRSSTTSVRSGLSGADQILGVENTLYNDSFEKELAAGNPSLVSVAKKAFEEAAKSRDRAETLVYALTDTATDSEINTAYDAVSLALTNTDTTLLYTRQVLDATFADSVDLSLTTLTNFKTTIDTARTSVQTSTTTLTSAKQKYDDAMRSGGYSVTDAALAVSRAEATLQSTKANAARDVANAEAALASANAARDMQLANVRQAEASYEKLTENPRAVDIAPYQSALASASARLKKTQIIAPFDGRITAVNIHRGEAANFGSAAITMEPTTDAFEIAVDIPESDVTKVSYGDRANITLDAFGDDLVFTGEVVSLDRSEKVIEGVVFYEATVVLSPDQDVAGLRSGMSADVTIITERKSAVLYVPQRAVLQHGDGSRYVRVPNGKTFAERTVVMGLRADDGMVEVVSGVQEGETIIVSIKK